MLICLITRSGFDFIVQNVEVGTANFYKCDNDNFTMTNLQANWILYRKVVAILWYPYVKIRKKVVILSILSKLTILASTFWPIKSKTLRVVRKMSTFWNHNKEYFHMLRREGGVQG